VNERVNLSVCSQPGAGEPSWMKHSSLHQPMFNEAREYKKISQKIHGFEARTVLQLLMKMAGDVLIGGSSCEVLVQLYL
jgi:hypothetical protein